MKPRRAPWRLATPVLCGGAFLILVQALNSLPSHNRRDLARHSANLTSHFAPHEPVWPSRQLVAFWSRFHQAHTERPFNVVLIRLESILAPHLAKHYGITEAMPSILSLARHSVIFDDYSATSPFAMEPFMRSLGEAAASQGYRTALFSSGYFSTLHDVEVLKEGHFEHLADADSNPYRKDYRHTDQGIREEATTRLLFEWIDAVRDKPFIGIYMPVAGHLACDALLEEHEQRYGTDGDIPRYNNRVAYLDSTVRTLLTGFDQPGLMDRTLFVVVGNHGERPRNWASWNPQALAA